MGRLSANSIHILYTDENPERREGTADTLESEDNRFAVTTAGDLDEASALRPGIDCDVIVTTVDISESSGVGLVERVRELDEACPIVLLGDPESGAIDPDAADGGITDFVPEAAASERPHLLAHRIRTAVERYRTSQFAEDLQRIRDVHGEITRALVRTDRRERLERRVCDIVSEAEPYRFAWVGEHVPDGGTVVARASAGVEQGYLDDIQVTSDDSVTGRGPTGRAIRTGDLAVMQDIPENDDYEPWRADALERGYRSSAAIPLSFGDRTYGVLNVYADRTNAFNDAERTLLSEIGDDIGHAIHRIELRERLGRRERYLEQSQAVAGVGTWHLDRETCESYWSPEVFRILGVPAEATPSRELYVECVHPADREALEAEWAAARDGAPIDVEHRIVDGDEVRWVRLKATPEEAPSGEPTEWIGVVQEVTERKTREGELQRAERKWRTLLEGAPDAIFIADQETGRIVETNQAAADMLGYPAEEILGMHQRELHPADEDGAYEALFDHHQSVAPDSLRTLPNGSPIYVETAAGEQVPVEINASEIRLGEEWFFQGIFRDVTDQRTYEENLTALHTATRELLHTDRPEDVGDVVVEAAAATLDVPAVGLYRFDPESTAFDPLATWSEFGDAELPSLGPADEAVWEAFTTGEITVLDAADTGRIWSDRPRDETLVVPVGDHGVLLAGGVDSATPGRVPDLAEILAATTAAAFDRLERGADLRSREAELERRNDRLARLNRINEQLREMSRKLVEANSREELQREVCRAIVAIDGFDFAWIGIPDFAAGDIDACCWAGSDAGYLDTVPISLTENGQEPLPAARAATSGEPAFVPTIGAGVNSAEWRQAALARGYRSVLSIPLKYEDVVYSVLSIYGGDAESFGELDRNVLSDFGQAIAMAINSLERRDALLSNERTELELDLSGPSCACRQISERAGCSFELDEVLEQDGESTRVTVRLTEGTPAALRSVVSELPTVEDVSPTRDGPERLFELDLSTPVPPTIVADYGGSLRSLTADHGEVRATVDIPASVPVRTIVDVLMEHYPNTTLCSKEGKASESRRTDRSAVGAELTDRQRESLEVAFDAGFFEWPRESTGEEVAAALDVSPSTFHRHIRRVQQKTFATLLESRAGPD